jgi:fluoroquinolone transport system permease protein
MSRLWSTIRWDMQLEWRQGLFHAALLVALVWIILFSQVNALIARYLLPAMLYIDLSIFGFFFMAGLLYLEKGEGVLAALVVSPLRSWQYLAAKLATLSALGLLVSLVVVAVVRRDPVHWPVLIGGLTLNSLLFILASFVLAVRYDAINEFLIPAVWLLGAAHIPLLDSFGIWSGWPLYLLPFQASLLLVRGAFEPLAGWQWAYALAYVGVCIVLGFLWALRVFEQFVVRGKGGRA